MAQSMDIGKCKGRVYMIPVTCWDYVEEAMNLAYEMLFGIPRNHWHITPKEKKKYIKTCNPEFYEVGIEKRADVSFSDAKY